jgi:hypothetical protein
MNTIPKFEVAQVVNFTYPSSHPVVGMVIFIKWNADLGTYTYSLELMGDGKKVNAEEAALSAL